MRTRFAEEYAGLDRRCSQQIEALRAELQSIEGSRAWRLALRFRRYVGTLRKVRDSLWARPQLQR